MTTAREQILTALFSAINAGLYADVLREAVVGEQLSSNGLVILRDGEPGEPEYTFSPLRYHYEHRVELEIFVEASDPEDRADAFDLICAQIGVVLASDRTLGGRCDWMMAEAPQPVDLPLEGATPLKAAIIGVILHYAVSDPLA